MVERLGSYSDSGYVATALTSAVINIDAIQQQLNNSNNNNNTPNQANSSDSMINRSSSETKKAKNGSVSKSNKKRSSTIESRKKRSFNKTRDKNSKITTMLLAISASFVLLNFPYFLVWCNYAYSRVTRTVAIQTSPPRSTTQISSLLANVTAYQNETVMRIGTAAAVASNQANISFAFLRITEALNLLNYAINGFLYFSTGKLYREHLLFLLGCKYAKSPSF